MQIQKVRDLNHPLTPRQSEIKRCYLSIASGKSAGVAVIATLMSKSNSRKEGFDIASGVALLIRHAGPK